MVSGGCADGADGVDADETGDDVEVDVMVVDSEGRETAVVQAAKTVEQCGRPVTVVEQLIVRDEPLARRQAVKQDGEIVAERRDVLQAAA